MKIVLFFLAACIYSYVGIVFLATMLQMRHRERAFSFRQELFLLCLAHAFVARGLSV